jgi:signal transduction histidine kinase
MAKSSRWLMRLEDFCCIMNSENGPMDMNDSNTARLPIRFDVFSRRMLMRAKPLLVVALLIAVMSMATGCCGLWVPQAPFWETWWFRGVIALVLGGSVIGGYRLRVRSIKARSRELEEQVVQLTAELQQELAQRKQIEETLRKSETLQAVATERNRLAQELLDAITQTLFSASLISETLPAIWKSNQDEGRELLHELRQLSRSALAEMRTLLLELRPATLAEANLGNLLHQLGEAVTGRTGVPVTVTIEGQIALPYDIHIALYRIAQETLNNIVKHAQASQVTVSLRGALPYHTGGEWGEVELRISDDGCGFDPSHISPDRLGLGIIRERAQAIGATLEIASESGSGTQVLVEWSENKHGIKT